MKMKANIYNKIIFVLALMAITMLPFAAAVEQTEENVGTTPDSPMYGISKAFDRINLALTLNKAAKAEKALRLAEKRMLKVEAMIEEGKGDKSVVAQKDYEAMIDAAESAVQAINSDGTSEKAITAIEKSARLQNLLERHAQKVAEVKDRILERHRGNMTDEQIARLEAVFDKIIEKADGLDDKIATKRENARTRFPLERAKLK
jgi:Fe2+ transport system protein B